MLRVSEPDLSRLELANVNQAVESTLISGTGPFVVESEHSIQAMTGASYALATSNGTASLHLCLMTLGLAPGDEVIVPSFTYIASVNAILYVGASPVFVDVDADTWTIDPAEIVHAISPRTKAIMAVHLYGHPFDGKLIRDIANQHGLFVIEDAAEGHVSTSHGNRAGNIGDIASFSFFGNKVLTAGEGGAITTNRSNLYELAAVIRNQGMNPNRRFEHNVVGNNFRLNNVSAAILAAQLQRREEILQKRQTIIDAYTELLSGTKFELHQRASWATTTPWLFSLLMPKGTRVSRDLVLRRLESRGIETRPLFLPAHSMKPYKNFRRGSKKFTNSIELSERGFNLPTSSKMSTTEAEWVVAELMNAAEIKS